MTRFDVVGFGALNVDRLFKVDRIASGEEEVFIKEESWSCGGSAANTIVGLSRLGFRTGFIGKTAKDREGDMLVECFEKENVDTSGIIQVDSGHSGLVLGFVDKEGQRALYIDSGINDFISTDDVKTDYVSESRFVHMTSFVGGQSFQTQQKLIGSISGQVKLSFDPGALYAQKGLSQLMPIIQKTYLMMPNLSELKLITNKQTAAQGANFLIDKGVKICAVKLGSKGCYVTDGKESHQIESFKVPVVDTTGAGDAFNSGFLYGLLKGKNLLECGKIGNFAASRCVTKMCARDGLPYEKDLELLD